MSEKKKQPDKHEEPPELSAADEKALDAIWDEEGKKAEKPAKPAPKK